VGSFERVYDSFEKVSGGFDRVYGFLDKSVALFLITILVNFKMQVVYLEELEDGFFPYLESVGAELKPL